MTLSKVLYICTYVFLIMYIIMFVSDASIFYVVILGKKMG